jgi:hypothetical protein
MPSTTSPSFDLEDSLPSPSQPLREDVVDDDDDDSDTSFIQPPRMRRPHEDSTESAILEALPLLRKPSVYLDRAKVVSLGTGRRPMYDGSDDGGDDSDADGGGLVRVQSGVKKVEAITLLWTRKSLIVAYVR